MHPSGAEEIKTACRACHGGCGVIVTVKGGQVTKIRPDPDSPLSQGRICAKGAAGIELLYHPKRLRYPMKSAGARGEGKWERISWDDAYQILCDNITKIKNEYGAEAISLVQGTGRHHLKHTIRFANALGTPNWFEPGAAQCYFPRVCTGMITFGSEAGIDYYGKVVPKCILVWGCNPISCGIGLRAYIDKWDKLLNSDFIVVDPRRTELARRAKIWLRIRPGTDSALALGMLNIIITEGLYDKEFVDQWTFGFDALRNRCAEYTPDKVSEITWIDKESIIAAAKLFAQSNPASLEWGSALEHTPNTFQTVRAVAILPIITGNYDIPGGFVENMYVMPSPDTLNEVLSEEQDGKRLGAKDYPLLSSGKSNFCPTSHIPSLFNAALTGKPYPIKALLLFGNNSLMEVSQSEQTPAIFAAMDFVSCMDLFMTPTAELADLVLPAASWLEYDHVFSSGNGSAGQSLLCTKRITRIDECMADEEVFIELARRLSLDYRADSAYDIINAQLSRVSSKYPEYARLDFEKMKELNYITFPVEYQKYKERGGFNTPTGKVELYSTIMERLGLDPLPSFAEPPESPYSRPDLAEYFPLVLTTGGRQRQYFLSEGRYIESLRHAAPFPIVELHPETAARYGIEDGDWIFIENTRGRITQKAKLTDGIDPRVVHCQMGWYYPEAGPPEYGWRESNANFLTSMQPPYDLNSGTYQLKGLLCRIAKNPDKSIEDRFCNSEFFQ